MSVRHCVFPWHWALITNDGDVLPCSHGAAAVGNLRDNTIEEIWNGPLIQEVRGCLLKGEVHRVCRSAECPFQREHPAFPERTEPLFVEESLARAFDEDWYLATYWEVRLAVFERRFTSGLEHYIRHGRQLGMRYRLKVGISEPPGDGLLKRCWSFLTGRWRIAPRPAPIENGALGLLDYAQGRTVLRAKPADLILVVTTICNLRCVMCPHGMRLVENPRPMPVELLERARPYLDTASRMIVSGLGEPTMAASFWWIIEHVRDRTDLFIRANSNGHFLTPEKAGRILNSGLKEISFSLDAANPETYAKIRGGDFQRALAGIATLLEARVARPERTMTVYINMTLMRENLAEAADFVRLGHRIGADGVVFTQLFTFGDRPDWRVDRPDWTFVYSEQMIGRVPAEARQHLLAAKKCSDEIGMPIHLRDNVESYLPSSS